MTGSIRVDKSHSEIRLDRYHIPVKTWILRGINKKVRNMKYNSVNQSDKLTTIRIFYKTEFHTFVPREG